MNGTDERNEEQNTRLAQVRGRLVAGGFSVKMNEERTGFHVRCTQCAALVINGVATHELGCPNRQKSRRRD